MKEKRKARTPEPEPQLNVRIPKALDARLGHYLVDHPVPVKKVAVAQAIDEYLKKRGA